MELEQRARAFLHGARSCGCAETGSLCVFFCAQLCVHPERGLSFTRGWSQPQKPWWAELWQPTCGASGSLVLCSVEM